MRFLTTMFRLVQGARATTLMLVVVLASACETTVAPDAARRDPDTTRPLPDTPRPTSDTILRAVWRDVVTYTHTTCALRDSGQVYCLTDGDSTPAPRALPSPPSAPVTAISMGFSGGPCALASDGVVRCWSGASWTAPIGEEVRFTQIVGGAGTGCALASGGTPWCWWHEPFPRSSRVVLHLAPVGSAPALARIGYGYYFACGLSRDNQAFCWNVGPVEGTTGQLGDGTLQSSPTAVAVRTDLRFASLAVGSSHACGLTSVGEAWCWGSNMANELGAPRDTPHEGCGTTSVPTTAFSWATHWCTMPRRVETALRFRSLAAGTERTCGVTNDGAAYCWGANRGLTLGSVSLRDGACQLGGSLSRPVACTPVATAVTGGLQFAALGSDRGGYHQCGITVGGRAYCWGVVRPDGRPAPISFDDNGMPLIATTRPVALADPSDR